MTRYGAQFGPDFTFHTPVLRDGSVGADGTLAGNLYLRGVGDPSLSTRFWHDDNPMDELAKQIAAKGIKRVHGDIVGDATAFDDQLVPDGWKSSYLGASYAARVSALSLNENLVWVAVQPNGGKAQVTLERGGWVLGSDGVYSRAGQRLSFAISHDGSPAHSQEVDLIRAQCRQAGMEITNSARPNDLDDDASGPAYARR